MNLVRRLYCPVCEKATTHIYRERSKWWCIECFGTTEDSDRPRWSYYNGQEDTMFDGSEV